MKRNLIDGILIAALTAQSYLLIARPNRPIPTAPLSSEAVHAPKSSGAHYVPSVPIQYSHGSETNYRHGKHCIDGRSF